MTKKALNSIENYIAGFPHEVQKKLEELRAAIRKSAPGAEELISYRMPSFKLNGMLVWYAAYGSHIGFYPTASGIKAFENRLTKYNTSKGAVQFPLDMPIPLTLVKDMVKFRVKENAERMRSRVAGKKISGKK